MTLLCSKTPINNVQQSGTLHFDATYGWSHKIATFCTSQYLFQAEIDPVWSEVVLWMEINILRALTHEASVAL